MCCMHSMYVQHYATAQSARAVLLRNARMLDCRVLLVQPYYIISARVPLTTVRLLV